MIMLWNIGFFILIFSCWVIVLLVGEVFNINILLVYLCFCCFILLWIFLILSIEFIGWLFDINVFIFWLCIKMFLFIILFNVFLVVIWFILCCWVSWFFEGIWLFGFILLFLMVFKIVVLIILYWGCILWLFIIKLLRIC